jgi:hypothetical protein
VTRELAVRLVLAVARLFLWVREATGKNDGPPVEAIQKSTGNKRGDAWCASFVWFVLRVLVWLGVTGLDWLRTASCDAMLEGARRRGLLREHPAPGYIGLLLKSEHDAIHAYFCTGHTAGGSHPTIEGNTNPGGGRDGYGVFERQRGGPDDPIYKLGYGYTFIDWPALLAA